MPIESFKTIIRAKMKQMLDSGQELVLIDVLPPEYFEELHIQGALNACVYDINFTEQVETLVPDKERMIVVYCNNSTSKATEWALGKLNKAGFHNVYIYRGGAQDWRRARLPVEGTQINSLFAPQIQNKVYTVDLAESGVQWTGRNITGLHFGTIDIKSGVIPIQRKHPVKVSFVMDMHSIQDLDIQEEKWNQLLVKHLKSDDFFDVETYPEAKFDATAFEAISGTTGGGVPNYTVTGKLTMKGITKEISFPALVAMRDDGALAAEAHFDIDRTEWKINYGSGKLFDKLGRHLVHDMITIQIKLVAR